MRNVARGLSLFPDSAGQDGHKSFSHFFRTFSLTFALRVLLVFFVSLVWYTCCSMLRWCKFGYGASEIHMCAFELGLVAFALGLVVFAIRSRARWNCARSVWLFEH